MVDNILRVEMASKARIFTAALEAMTLKLKLGIAPHKSEKTAAPMARSHVPAQPAGDRKMFADQGVMVKNAMAKKPTMSKESAVITVCDEFHVKLNAGTVDDTSDLLKLTSSAVCRG